MGKAKTTRLGEERYNNQGCLMRIIEYNRNNDIIVEFQDEHRAKVHAQYAKFIQGGIRNPYIRIGEEAYNNDGCLMKIVEYNNTNDIIVEFQDEYKLKVHTGYNNFLKGKVKNMAKRLNEERLNNQGCLMKIIQYNSAQDIMVEFQDKYKAKVNAQYSHFIRGQIKNPFFTSVLGVGIIGVKYPASINNKATKEYITWRSMLARCYDKKFKEKHPYYKDTTCCDKWLFYENFYEWLHEQENFDKWFNGDRWAIDKDIVVKGNKLYSPETCCLVSQNVNALFTKNDAIRGKLPIGVSMRYSKFSASCHNPFTNKQDKIGVYSTIEEAFFAYKKYKENLIRQVAQIEFNNGNITEKCYNAMMSYEVEITD